MNRKIEFRAQDIASNKWLYGDLRHHKEDVCIFEQEGNKGEQVKRDTIGQYTGMHDKNGKEIYEGDILDVIVFDYFGNDEQYKVRVEWVGTEFTCVDVTNDEHVWNLCWLCNQDEEIEVIGNIYDNPELLNRE